MASYHRCVLLLGLAYLLVIWGLAAGHFYTILPCSSQIDSYSLFVLAAPAIVILLILILMIHHMPPLVTIVLSVLTSAFISVFITIDSLCGRDYSLCGGLLLALLAFVILSASLLINYKWQSMHVSAIFIILVSILFTLIFSSPIVEAKKITSLPSTCLCNGCFAPHYQFSVQTTADTGVWSVVPREDVKLEGANQRLDDSTIDLIKSEHANAVDEIKERSKINDDWFHNKFVLVGGLLAALLIHLKWIGYGNTTESAVNDLQKLFKTTIIPASILGMACVVSLAIDIHIGNNQMIVQQLAHWIKNCVEPFLNTNSDHYVDWENFIRIERGDAKGMHMDTIFNLFNASHFYLGSILLYIVYTSCLFACFAESRNRNEYVVSVFIFGLVHLTLIMFGVGANSFPSTFEVKLAVWSSRHFSGETAGVIPFLICVLVGYMTFTRLQTLYDHPSKVIDENS